MADFELREADDPGHNVIEYWVIDGDQIDTTAVARRDIGWAMAQEAPAEFGAYGGHTFSSISAAPT